MDFKVIQEAAMKNVDRYSKKHNVTIDADYATLKLMEEAGEFAQAVLIYKKRSRPEKFVSEEASLYDIGKELADIVGMAMLNAHLLDIDLESILREKWKVDQFVVE